MLCCKNFSRVHCFFSDHYQRADNAHGVGCVSPCPKSAFTSHHRSALICFTNTKKSIGLLQNRADWYNSLSHSPQMTKSSLLTISKCLAHKLNWPNITNHHRLCEMDWIDVDVFWTSVQDIRLVIAKKSTRHWRQLMNDQTKTVQF